MIRVLTLAAAAALSLALPAASFAADPAVPKLSQPGQNLPASVFAARRAALMKAMGNEGVAVIFAEGSEDFTGFRQSSDFYYLTGVEEKGAVLVLAPKERTYKEFLYLPSRDPEAERWIGERLPLGAELRTRYGFQKIYRGTPGGALVDLASRSPILWQVMRPSGGEARPRDLELYSKVQGKVPGVSVKTLGWTLAKMRSKHDDTELAIMQKSIRITEEGHRAAWALVKPGAAEGAVRAEAERVWRTADSRRPAYETIVGSGPNSTILHYPRSERVMQAGELLLMDMGTEYAHYATDITRTLPVSGKFTDEQRKVYDVVLKAQAAAFALAKPGAYYEDLDAAARKVIDDAGYGDYFIHGLGHFVGLDVHDAGAYHDKLEPGMVLTLEPGIYIPGKNIGIRIEDEILITKDGARYLTDGLPKTADDIEHWMSQHVKK